MTTSGNPPQSNGDLGRLPWLASPLLTFDLGKELDELRSTESWNRETGRSSKTLAKHPDFRIVLVAMKAHTHMNQHRAEGRVSIQQLRGETCVRLRDREVTLKAGSLMVLDVGVLHDVEALEECAFLLTISWSGERRVLGENDERAFDEDALLRMSDEGAP